MKKKKSFNSKSFICNINLDSFQPFRNKFIMYKKKFEKSCLESEEHNFFKNDDNTIIHTNTHGTIFIENWFNFKIIKTK